MVLYLYSNQQDSFQNKGFLKLALTSHVDYYAYLLDEPLSEKIQIGGDLSKKGECIVVLSGIYS